MDEDSLMMHVWVGLGEAMIQQPVALHTKIAFPMLIIKTLS